MKSEWESERQAATYIQFHWRGHLFRAQATKKKHAARLAAAARLQRAWRHFVFKRSFRRLVVFGLEAAGAGWPTVSMIQRCWRAARLRRRYRGILGTLNDRYLSDEQMRTNAASGAEWYTPAMMLRRERVYRDGKVQAALENAWQAVTSASARQHSTYDPDKLSWPQYAEMARKIYLCLMKRNDPREAFLLAKIDWERDTRNWPDPSTPLMERAIDHEAFFHSWFELADVNTDEMDEYTYGKFIKSTVHKIVVFDPHVDTYVLRSDADVMNFVVNGGGRYVEPRPRLVRPPLVPEKSDARYFKHTAASRAHAQTQRLAAANSESSLAATPREELQLAPGDTAREEHTQPLHVLPSPPPAAIAPPSLQPPAHPSPLGMEPPRHPLIGVVEPPPWPLKRAHSTKVPARTLPTLPKRTGTMPEITVAIHTALRETPAPPKAGPDDRAAPSELRLRRRSQASQAKPVSKSTSRRASLDLALHRVDTDRVGGGAGPRPARFSVGVVNIGRKPRSFNADLAPAVLPSIRTSRPNPADVVARLSQPRQRSLSRASRAPAERPSFGRLALGSIADKEVIAAQALASPTRGVQAQAARTRTPRGARWSTFEEALAANSQCNP
jgi:hypothetical protein